MIHPGDTQAVVVGAGIVLAAILLVTGGITVLMSVIGRVRDRRQDKAEPEVSEAILERLYDEDPDWTAWVAGLDRPQRVVTEQRLDEYLRTLRGNERDRLEKLGDAMELDERALQALRTGGRYERLQALTWLALLRHPVDADILFETCTDDDDLRASAARVLHESNVPEAKTIGTDLLFGDSDGTLSAFGMDTLYRLHSDDPSELLVRGNSNHDNWPPSRLVQVLAVLRHCGLAGLDAPVTWVSDLLEHDSSAVAVAAAGALEAYGWRRDLREQLDEVESTRHADPEVRRAIYRMLAGWGDTKALDALAAAAHREPDDRARLTALYALVDQPDRVDTSSNAEIRRTWSWARADAAIRSRLR